MKNFILIFSSFLTLNFCQAQHLSGHRWHDRVILLFAPDPHHPQLAEQISILTKNLAEVTDRNLVIYRVHPGGGRNPALELLPEAEADFFYHKYDIPADAFTFILIGKDGTEKMRSKEPVSLEELLGLIDSMPMRRAEMRREGG